MAVNDDNYLMPRNRFRFYYGSYHQRVCAIRIRRKWRCGGQEKRKGGIGRWIRRRGVYVEKE